MNGAPGFIGIEPGEWAKGQAARARALGAKAGVAEGFQAGRIAAVALGGVCEDKAAVGVGGAVVVLNGAALGTTGAEAPGREWVPPLG